MDMVVDITTCPACYLHYITSSNFTTPWFAISPGRHRKQTRYHFIFFAYVTIDLHQARLVEKLHKDSQETLVNFQNVCYISTV